MICGCAYTEGVLVEVAMDAAGPAALKDEAGDGTKLIVRFEIEDEAENRGGLSRHGEKLGCYPVSGTTDIGPI